VEARRQTIGDDHQRRLSAWKCHPICIFVASLVFFQPAQGSRKISRAKSIQGLHRIALHPIFPSKCSFPSFDDDDSISRNRPLDLGHFRRRRNLRLHWRKPQSEKKKHFFHLAEEELHWDFLTFQGFLCYFVERTKFSSLFRAAWSPEPLAPWEECWVSSKWMTCSSAMNSLGGPPGLAVGGALGGCLASYVAQGKLKPIYEVRFKTINYQSYHKWMISWPIPGCQRASRRATFGFGPLGQEGVERGGGFRRHGPRRTRPRKRIAKGH